ncbi:sorting nexin-16 isoform X1 [Fundulus heteroclitus]|uniref:sorting nexin-16 isoform X1 n=2 Tax=Fundulus heteroclitus TaxID=8078 RepID=UPI00165AFF58|nr:sorting nexin-16 isoform X1 [Fundulus heteroclitus]
MNLLFCVLQVASTENRRMADPFVPVHFAVNWFTVNRSHFKRGASLHINSSTNSEAFIPRCCPLGKGDGPYRAPDRQTNCNETGNRARGNFLDGSANTGDSWEERSITATLLGYEILKERAKFTVYKILVQRPKGGSWLIFRRYTDFCILSDKLKELFPSFLPSLPSKRRFKDNYDDGFLRRRQCGLQTFLEDLMLHKDVRSSEPVRHFLSVVDLQSPFYSMEESRVFCETLEQKNHRLLRELLDKQREVDSLKKALEDKENYINLLLKKGRALKDLKFQQDQHALNERDGCEWIEGWQEKITSKR